MTTRVRALYEFWAQNSAELSFQPGEIITVVNQEDEGWWEGDLHGVRGLFPSNYVEVLVGNQALPSSKFSFIPGHNGIGGSLIPSETALESAGMAFPSQTNVSEINFEEYQALQALQSRQLDLMGEESLNLDAWNMVQQAQMKEQLIEEPAPADMKSSDMEMKSASYGSSAAISSPWTSSTANAMFASKGSGSKNKIKFKTIGLTWISGLGLFGSIVALACSIFSLYVLQRGDVHENKFLVQNVFDYQVTGWVALYTMMAGVFTLILEWYQMRLGDNGSCSMIARSSAYFFMSLYMWLSFETFPAAGYFVFLSVANIVYEYKICG